MFPVIAALGIATAPAVDLNAFPTDMTPVEFTVSSETIVDYPYIPAPIAYEWFNGVTISSAW